MIKHDRHRIPEILRERLPVARTRLARHFAVGVVVASLVALPPGTGTAIARSHGGTRAYDGNSSAVAINTTDDSLAFKLTFAILDVTGNVIDNQNAADAYASCDHCQTVAISIQTLLVVSAASIVAPINEASSRNQNCVQCDTVAIAYQFVVAAGTELKFTRTGRREIAYIRHQLERLRRDARRGMTGAQILTAVAALMQQYSDILSTELVPASQRGAGDQRTDAAGETPPAGATSATGQNPAVPAQATTSPTNPDVTTTTSTTSPSANPGSATSPTSTTTPTATSSAAAGMATTPTTAPTDPATTPTTTTGTTPTTTTTSAVTTTPSGASNATPAGTTTTPSSSAPTTTP
jgi:putative peptide zinc metalloprotease protein